MRWYPRSGLGVSCYGSRDRMWSHRRAYCDICALCLTVTEWQFYMITIIIIIIISDISYYNHQIIFLFLFTPYTPLSIYTFRFTVYLSSLMPNFSCLIIYPHLSRPNIPHLIIYIFRFFQKIDRHDERVREQRVKGRKRGRRPDLTCVWLWVFHNDNYSNVAHYQSDILWHTLWYGHTFKIEYEIFNLFGETTWQGLINGIDPTGFPIPDTRVNVGTYVEFKLLWAKPYQLRIVYGVLTLLRAYPRSEVVNGDRRSSHPQIHIRIDPRSPPSRSYSG